MRFHFCLLFCIFCKTKVLAWSKTKRPTFPRAQHLTQLSTKHIKKLKQNRRWYSLSKSSFQDKKLQKKNKKRFTFRDKPFFLIVTYNFVLGKVVGYDVTNHFLTEIRKPFFLVEQIF